MKQHRLHTMPPDEPTATEDQAPTRKRPKPGERRIQILQTLAAMLEQPAGERITTAALAARLDVSEAALYRHFASKAQMFEGLIEFIEQSVFTLANQIVEREQPAGPGAGARQSAIIISMLVQFAERNPGMARVMVGDALVFEERTPAGAHEPVLRQDRGHAQAVPARQRRPQLAHAHHRCPGARRRADRLCDGPLAALCALGFQAPALRTSGQQPGPDARVNPRHK